MKPSTLKTVNYSTDNEADLMLWTIGVAVGRKIARLAEVEAERDALAAKVERVRAECVRGYGYAGWLALARPVLAILDGTYTHCNRGPCHLPAGHGGPCNPGDDANTDERTER